jgi:gamma-glutamyl:cysteine ligase YbdK (ATP-grasp superfamily)
MGTEIDTAEFTPADFARFTQRLPQQVQALEQLLARPGFGAGVPSIGAEVEFFLLDERGDPCPISLDVVGDVDSTRVTPELARFEIELATAPVPLAGRSFAALEADIVRTRARIDAAAAKYGARTGAFGILPTLRHGDLTAGAITDLPRYHALTRGLRRMRQAPFRIHIEGDDVLEIMSDDAAMEGANTAFQVHLRVEPGAFARTFNAAQIATAPALAAAVNSPTFLGRRLWAETRFALFTQAGDVRPADRDGDDWEPPARIGCGTGWMREGAAEQFRESVALHDPLLPVLGDEDAEAVVAAGGVPQLAELRLHHGTVWYWNRAVYDPTDGGHLRIELRALPSGPTVTDMLANAAFLLGLTLDLADDVGALLPAFPFECAERNLQRAARDGLDAELLWPRDTASAPEPVAARALLPSLIERARRGLIAAGVDAAEVKGRLDVFAARVDSGRTGAEWQRRALADGVHAMVQRYLAHASTEAPVHTWPTNAP